MSENRLSTGVTPAPTLDGARRDKLAAVIGAAPAPTVTALLREAGVFAPLAPILGEDGAIGTIPAGLLVDLVRAALAPPVDAKLVEALLGVLLGDRLAAAPALGALGRAAAKSSGDAEVRLLALTIETVLPALTQRAEAGVAAAVAGRAAEAGAPILERVCRLLAATGDDLGPIAAALPPVLHTGGAGGGDAKTLLAAALALGAGAALRHRGLATLDTAEDWAAFADAVRMRAEGWRAARGELGAALGLSRATQADRAVIDAARVLTRRLADAARAALAPLYGDPGRHDPGVAAAAVAAAQVLAGADAWAETLGATEILANVRGRLERAVRDPELQGALDVLSALARLDPDAALGRADAAGEVAAVLLDPLSARALTRRLRAAVGRPDLDSVVLALLDPITLPAGAASVAHRVTAAAVDAAWRWAGATGAPALIADADARLGRLVKARDVRGVRDLAVEVRLGVAEALRAARADHEPGLAAALAAFGPGGGAEVDTIARLLSFADLFDSRLGDWPMAIPSLDAAKLEAARDCVDTAVAREPEAGVGLLVYFMHRLKRPWEVLELLQRVTRQRSDVVLERTEYGLVGHRLLDEAEAALAAFVWPREGPLDLPRTIAALTVFGGVVAGFMGAFTLRKDGEWGKRCAALTRKGAEKLAALCEAAEAAVEAATPRAPGPRGGFKPALDAEADPRLLARAVAAVGFLRRTQLHDQRAAFGAARAKALGAVEARLQSYEDALLDALHEGEPAAPAQLAAFAQVIEAFHGPERAAVLRRRAAAA